jgi:exopolyphosphatase/guanosine-5'-triphosphate,3'-diphosphate pyrophosphatase
VKERAALPGLDQKRADIILAGALVLEQVVDVLGIHELTFSDFALREGVLLDTWQRRRGGSLHHLQDIRRRSVDHLAALDEDPEHSAQVARLALELFDGLAHRHGLDAAAREILEAGALLANVGVFVSHAGHHKHSYYLIRNSEHLTGFTDREIELIAQVARYHRKSAPSSRHPFFGALVPEDQRRVVALAGLLRVAVGLDRDHAQRVADLRFAADNGAVVVEVVSRPDQDVTLELFSANQRSELLATALDRPVEVVAVA